MNVPIHFSPIEYSAHELAEIWHDISRHWALRGGTNDIIPGLKERIEVCTPGMFKGIVAYRRQIPVAMGWVEQSSPTYGNMIVHALAPEFRHLIPEYIISHNWLDGVFVELVQFEDTLEYRRLFLSLGAKENARQRMGVDISQFEPMPCPIPGLSFELLTPEDSPITSEISTEAHRYSKDYDGFLDLESTPHRMAMDQRLFEDFYGPLIREVSLKMMYDGRIVGSTASVEIKCWGFEKVPWVFDISVDARYRGRGFGKALFVEVMSRLVKLGYPVMGLAVTMSNVEALRLYERMGFVITDPFIEFTTGVQK